MDVETARPLVEAAFRKRDLLGDAKHEEAVLFAIEALDRGEIRVAEPARLPSEDAGGGPGGEAATSERGSAAEPEWIVHAWVKEAILLYFAIRKMEPSEAGPLSFCDKVPIKRGLAEAGVRVVPPGTVRYGAYLERGVIVMPGYVNIGARVGAGSMVDTWATVGSCAQIGRDVHLAGGVGIGGVLEPPGARPVIVEDGAFIGSRVVIVEGVHVGKEAVVGAGVVLTSSTAIIDVTGDTPVELRGAVPARSVVIPGTRPKRFPAGEFHVPCALIIGKRSASTDRKVSLESALRDFGVPA